MLDYKMLLNTYSMTKKDNYIFLYNIQGQVIKEIDCLCLNNSDKGKLYEKYVGLLYESKGYEVIYNGLENGKLDGGIDLICKSNKKTLFLQCKYTHQCFGQQKIEQLLYKTSMFFRKHKFPLQYTFVIVVPNIVDCFSKKNMDYLLYKNNFINNGKIEIQEIDFA